MSDERIQASPELQLFFTKLLELKQFIKDALDNTNEEILHEIYNKLDAIIREKK